jgi:hypothetical protein
MAQPPAPKQSPRLPGRASLPEKHGQHAKTQEKILDEHGHIMKQEADPDHQPLPSSISAMSRRTGATIAFYDARGAFRERPRRGRRSSALDPWWSERISSQF